MTPMQKTLMEGFSQEFIDLESCHDAHQVQAKMKRAAHEIINRFDAVTNAQRHAQEYGVGFIRVERDGSMKAIDPRSVILK